MERNRITTNRKTTPGRNIYYQDVMGLDKEFYEQRIVKILNNCFWRLLLWLKIINKYRLIVRERVKVGETFKRLKTIKHQQFVDTYSEKMIQISDMKNRHISTRNPRTIAKRAQKRRAYLVWDSANKGTYVRKQHGELGYV